MKTRKISMVVLSNVAYGYCFVEPEKWIDNQAGFFLKSDNSTCTFVIRRDGDAFEVDVRTYRKRGWSLLFYDKSARAVLQSLYDFLYV